MCGWGAKQHFRCSDWKTLNLLLTDLIWAYDKFINYQPLTCNFCNFLLIRWFSWSGNTRRNNFSKSLGSSCIKTIFWSQEMQLHCTAFEVFPVIGDERFPDCWSLVMKKFRSTWSNLAKNYVLCVCPQLKKWYYVYFKCKTEKFLPVGAQWGPLKHFQASQAPINMGIQLNNMRYENFKI